MASDTTTIGLLPVDDIARQLAYTLRMRRATTTDVMTMSDEDWNDVAIASLGIHHGFVRLAVMQILLDGEAEVTTIRRAA